MGKVKVEYSNGEFTTGPWRVTVDEVILCSESVCKGKCKVKIDGVACGLRCNWSCQNKRCECKNGHECHGPTVHWLSPWKTHVKSFSLDVDEEQVNTIVQRIQILRTALVERALELMTSSPEVIGDLTRELFWGPGEE